jgi:ectoine hydroxylase-related dioxygenase (phytanoyl-CoA dioxygenase family)
MITDSVDKATAVDVSLATGEFVLFHVNMVHFSLRNRSS